MYSVVAMTSSAVPRASAPHWSPRLWAILIVLCGALFLDALDVSMVGVALPSIRADLGLTTSSLQWVVSGYVLGYGGLLLLGGRAADLLGRRRVFLTALAVFAVASLFGGLVSSAGLLIAARFIKGVAAAFTAPASLSIITTTFAEGPQRNRAVSIYSAFGASGFSLGLVLSGLLTEVSWRWTLLLPAPGRAPHPGGGAATDTPRAAAGQPPPALRPARRGHRDRRHAAARGGGGRSPAVRLDLGGHPRLLRRRGRAACGVRCHRTPQPGPAAAVRHLPFGLADPGQPVHPGPVRVLRVLPVPGHAVPADRIGLDGARDRPRVPAGRRPGRGRLTPDGAAAGPVRLGPDGHGGAWLPRRRDMRCSCGSGRSPITRQ